jgi:transposase InsO family protein
VKNLHARDAKRYHVNVLCELLGVSKQAYYKHDENADLARAAQEEFALQYIRQVRSKDPGIGGMKLWLMYRRDFSVANPMGRDRFEDLVDRWGLKVRKRVRAPRTTDSGHGLPTYPNLIRDFIPMAPNRLWVSDITYITVWLSETAYVFCYLSLVTDAYTEEIIGWSVGETLDATYPIMALKMALKRIEGVAKEEVNLIHHSDRGCQYASSEYVKLLATNGIRISMTESGDPKENAQAERVNGTLKNELLKDRRFRSVEEVRSAVSDAVSFYNNERPHMSIGMMTPAEAANCTGELEKKWKSYRVAAIKKKAHNSDIAEKGLPLPPCQRSPSGLRPTVNL